MLTSHTITSNESWQKVAEQAINWIKHVKLPIISISTVLLHKNGDAQITIFHHDNIHIFDFT